MIGLLERELIYYPDGKRYAVCGADVIWAEAEIHHVEQHRHGGKTILPNGALSHRHCHPKGATAEAAFAKKWGERMASVPADDPADLLRQRIYAEAELEEENGETV